MRYILLFNYFTLSIVSLLCRLYIKAGKNIRMLSVTIIVW